jgi:hypothetical protein
MKTKTTPTPKPPSPAGEKLRQMLIEIYAPIEWPSDEAEETPPAPRPI